MSIFLYREGIQGEVSDAGYTGWMDILTFSWSVNRKITSASSTQGDRESANAVIGDLKITRLLDKATPKIFIEAACGTGKEVKLVQTKTGTSSGAAAFIEYTLKNAIISRYDVIAINDDVRPREEITISFIDVEVKYTAFDEDGHAEAPIAVGFNTATNTKK